VAEVAARDARLAALVERNGIPPVWSREPGFATLVLFILEQQVSLESARAAFAKLEEAAGPVAPASFLTLDDARLRTVGFSRQKARYCRDLAAALVDGTLDLAVSELDDVAVHDRLLGIRGVGPWTAGCYELFVLGRVDAWPTGDRALYVAMRDALQLDDVPSAAAGDELAGRWRPLRAVAARVLWHDYLARRGRDLHDRSAEPVGTTQAAEHAAGGTAAEDTDERLSVVRDH